MAEYFFYSIQGFTYISDGVLWSAIVKTPSIRIPGWLQILIPFHCIVPDSAQTYITSIKCTSNSFCDQYSLTDVAAWAVISVTSPYPFPLNKFIPTKYHTSSVKTTSKHLIQPNDQLSVLLWLDTSDTCDLVVHIFLLKTWSSLGFWVILAMSTFSLSLPLSFVFRWWCCHIV